MTGRFAGLPSDDLVTVVNAAGLPSDLSQGRDELLMLLALTEWERTPAALAYAEMAEDAARRGVSLLPEE
ncbi:hypothetical protein ACWCQK_40905 [Streptomyces sp. NPDC002306]